MFCLMVLFELFDLLPIWNLRRLMYILKVCLTITDGGILLWQVLGCFSPVMVFRSLCLFILHFKHIQELSINSLPFISFKNGTHFLYLGISPRWTCPITSLLISKGTFNRNLQQFFSLLFVVVILIQYVFDFHIHLLGQIFYNLFVILDGFVQLGIFFLDDPVWLLQIDVIFFQFFQLFVIFFINFFKRFVLIF